MTLHFLHDLSSTTMEQFPLHITTPPPQVNTFRIERVPWDDLAGRTLRDEQVAEISKRFRTPPENAPGIPPSADNITLFLLAYPENSHEPVACGALRHLDDGFMEVNPTPRLRNGLTYKSDKTHVCDSEIERNRRGAVCSSRA
ncbi:unnamed protein product [Rhizoctonia solani]|uniref:Uncharacterized protein n=1 Tax=Rhizoctonia solani TaxID=456999 RepID=A0A8H3D5K9_9AGAM|nr:unnamed protein product [Rhizoctonia solani]